MRAAVLLALTTLALVSAAGPISAQQPSQRDEQVVVVGAAPTREVVRRFVDEMAISSPSVNQLARWDRRICPGVVGLRPRYAQFLLDRIAYRAVNLGLRVGNPGCSANIMIFVTPEPDQLADELATEHAFAMGVLNEIGRTSLGRGKLRDFVESDAPVRWWHVNRKRTRDGLPVGRTLMWGMPPLDAGAPVFQVSGNASRLQRNTRQDFGAAFIVVDARTLEGINFNWEGLADYLAMVALAQLDPAADTSSYPTILNLFSQTSASGGARVLTDWDQAYLHGLYNATRDANSDTMQEGEIARSMARDLAAEPAQN